jgi:DHA1 family tetracycline resistance protein-like MFS transporter
VNGFVLTYIGLLVVIVQGWLVGWLAKRVDEYLLILISCVVMAISLFLWAFTPSLILLLVIITPVAFAGGLLNTLLNSTLSKAVYPEEVGGTLGISASLESLTRVIAPTAGGILIGSVGTWAPGVSAGLIMIATSLYAWWRLIIHPDPPLPEREQGPDSYSNQALGE